jgi:hypothetical protein
METTWRVLQINIAFSKLTRLSLKVSLLTHQIASFLMVDGLYEQEFTDTSTLLET